MAIPTASFKGCVTDGNITASAANRERKQALIVALAELDRRARERKIKAYYPDEGPLRRELYVKHLEFFRLGKFYRERLCLAANRVGKTEGLGLYELVLHATGWYPEWWEGRVFDQGIRAWAAGDTGETVREILQEKLLGPPGSWGTGLMPSECIVKITRAGGNIPDAADSIVVKHRSGSTSTILFKSYDQKRKAFQGTEQDLILLDEEPPLGIYVECLLRTMTSNGMMMLTFTPLLGMSEVVMQFLPEGKLDYYDNPLGVDEANASKMVVMMGWDDAPHLSDAAKRELEKAIPPYQRDARTKGVPQLGAGAIYPIPESDIIVPDFPIPSHWKKSYGLDVGWNRTAAIWGATDSESGVTYLWSEHYRGQAEPSVHAEAIRARGNWIPGAVDPAARGRSQRDGQKLLENYRDLGMKLTMANNSREAGIFMVWQSLSEGTLKVFGSLRNWLAEYRLYRRDDKGAIVKVNDHLMDATRYLKVTGIDLAVTQPSATTASKQDLSMCGGSTGWMA